MSKKLKIRKILRNNLPKGRFTFFMDFDLVYRNPLQNRSNSKKVEDIRKLLRDSGTDYHFDWYENRYKKRVYSRLYLKNAMDVALVKLVFHDMFRKIYKVEIGAYEPTSKDTDEAA